MLGLPAWFVSRRCSAVSNVLFFTSPKKPRCSSGNETCPAKVVHCKLVIKPANYRYRIDIVCLYLNTWYTYKNQKTANNSRDVTLFNHPKYKGI